MARAKSMPPRLRRTSDRGRRPPPLRECGGGQSRCSQSVQGRGSVKSSASRANRQEPPFSLTSPPRMMMSFIRPTTEARGLAEVGSTKMELQLTSQVPLFVHNSFVSRPHPNNTFLVCLHRNGSLLQVIIVPERSFSAFAVCISRGKLTLSARDSQRRGPLQAY